MVATDVAGVQAKPRRSRSPGAGVQASDQGLQVLCARLWSYADPDQALWMTERLQSHWRAESARADLHPQVEEAISKLAGIAVVGEREDRQPVFEWGRLHTGQVFLALQSLLELSDQGAALLQSCSPGLFVQPADGRSESSECQSVYRAGVAVPRPQPARAVVGGIAAGGRRIPQGIVATDQTANAPGALKAFVPGEADGCGAIQPCLLYTSPSPRD